MIIYLTSNFLPIDKEHADMAKVIPENGDAHYFIETPAMKVASTIYPNMGDGEILVIQHGGVGSGNIGHEGIPGHQGGSLPRGGINMSKIHGNIANSYRMRIARIMENIGNRFPSLSHITVSTSNDIGGATAEYDSTNLDIKVSEYLVKKEGNFENSPLTSFAVPSLEGTIYHEYGHAAVNAFEIYGSRHDFINEIIAMKQTMPMPSKYANNGLVEWACEYFALEQSKGENGPVSQLITDYFNRGYN